MISITSFLLLLAAVGCRGERDKTSEQTAPTFEIQRYPIEVVATTGMVADLVRNVGGAHVEVRQLLSSGTDPHLYKPTRDDVQAILAADIVFYSGLMLEGKMGDTLERTSRRKPVKAVTEEIDESLLLEPENAQGHPDPHVWNDVKTWSQGVDIVAQALGEIDPEHDSEYQANAASYRKQLDTLHEYGVNSLATVPEANRILVTSHDAFNYFGRAYGLEVLGVQGLSTESEAGLQRINELVDLLVQNSIQAVFVESSVPSKNIEALVNGAASRGHTVRIGGELFSDAMGPADAYEGTYIGMMDHNFTRVAAALGGEVPSRGMQGKLSDE
ncbi:MAG: zinc ABC transporter substrate-binding protein [Pirellulaceae bacterium]